MNSFLRVFLLGLGAASIASANSADFDGGVFATYASGMSMKNHVTQANLGAGIEFGYRSLENRVQVPCRVGLSVASFPGKSVNGVKNSLTHAQIAGDVFIASPFENTKLVIGGTFNHWRVSAKGPGYDISGGVKGIKFGGRIGVETQVSEKISLNLLWQVTELGTTRELEPQGKMTNAIVQVNPSWLQVGVRYHF